MALASLTDVLGSPAWTAAGAVFAAIGAFFGIYVFYRGRTTKAVSYVVDALRIMTVRGDAPITENTKFDDDVVVISVKLENVGNLPISAEDFERPLDLPLPRGAKPRSASVVSVRPPDLDPTLRVDGSGVTIDPLLLNPGDRLELSVTVADYTHAIRADGARIVLPPARARILGVNEITYDPRLLGGERGVLKRFALALGSMRTGGLVVTAIVLGLVPPALVLLVRAISSA